jgi:hypothetical protein
MYRGSRKHVLDWSEQPRFIPELLALAAPATPRVSSASRWMPRSYREPDEAQLDDFGPQWMPHLTAWAEIKRWWLKHSRGANTPNWDIALGCEIEGRPGLLLVEAKAHRSELKTEGKSLEASASENSRENHEQIGKAINEACAGWRCLEPGITISRDSHYQLANRLAFTWKLASLGVPTVLVYLGFVGDIGIRDAGPPLTSEEDWEQAFEQYVASSGCKALLERRLECAGGPAWVLVRARHVLEVSSPGAA